MCSYVIVLIFFVCVSWSREEKVNFNARQIHFTANWLPVDKNIATREFVSIFEIDAVGCFWNNATEIKTKISLQRFAELSTASMISEENTNFNARQFPLISRSGHWPIG